jgi:hypothetical protein
MAMKKSIGRTLARIDVSANTSVRIHEDFFNTHRDYHQLSHSATIHHHKCFWSEDRILRERAEGRVGRSVRDEDEVITQALSCDVLPQSAAGQALLVSAAHPGKRETSLD